MDAMEFFGLSAGRWKSSRATHHLAFKRSETGESDILVETLTADDPEIIALCQMHDIDPSLSIGGSRVRWLGTMSWDREGEENHEGKTVFAIVPDADNPRQGRLLRERGYAEIVPVVGRFHMDDEDGLVLTTDYETMSSIERFWFASPDMRMRTSTVKRFGGFSTASYCVESRVDTGVDATTTNATATTQLVSVLGW
jgi:CpeS-like protein